MLSVDLPVSLNVSLSTSPFSKLMPLKDASCAVVVICDRIPLYWLTRLERIACEAASAVGADPTTPAKALPATLTAVPLIAPIVAEAASFDVLRVIFPFALWLDANKL